MVFPSQFQNDGMEIWRLVTNTFLLAQGHRNIFNMYMYFLSLSLRRGGGGGGRPPTQKKTKEGEKKKKKKKREIYRIGGFVFFFFFIK